MPRTTAIAMATVGFFTLLVGCDDAKEMPETSANAAEGADEKAADVDLGALEKAMETIVGAQRSEDGIARRKACLAAVPQLEAAKEAAPDNKKVTALGTNLLPLCTETLDTKRMLKKLAEPKTQVQLSAAFAATFTSADLKKTYKDARVLSKKRRDPSKKCAEVQLLVGHLSSKKSRKTKKLVKKAKAFCDGPAYFSATSFHLQAAKTAMDEKSTSALVESCVHGIVALRLAPAGKKHDKLAAVADERCIEAVAMQGLLARDAT